jgi:glutathione S-transferase
MELVTVDVFQAGQDWAKLRRPGLVEYIRKRLGQLSASLGERDYLEGRFTAGDLMMTTMLRILRHTDLVAEHPNLAAFQARCEARPAFQRALRDQLAVFAQHKPAA